ncbi:TPA: ribulose-bisphosphate carboxylase large subunit, partial [archaeon]|nr:ribulose-bisphosphate carboxylase large subunit [Candidatus Naiadarchaeales archaeon SRR2090153.bin461]
TREMLARAKFVRDFGNEYVMMDILTAGWAGLQTVRDECDDLNLAIHAHRAFHAAFTRNKKHGASMKFVAETARLLGVDQLHIGTVIGKLESPKEEVFGLNERLKENWGRIKDVLPVCSGGLHPGLLPPLIKWLSKDIAIQVGGGIHGHPQGTRAGAKAVMAAIQAGIEGESLTEAAKKSKELAVAIKKWGYYKA